MNDKISIIVPVYNIEKYIEKCVTSIMDQTYKNLEIILVDDGSTDSSSVICDQLAKRDKRIKVIHKENGGPSDARNYVLKYATSKLIAFVDGDDFIEKNMYEILYKNLNNNNADISICSRKIEYENGKDCKKRTMQKNDIILLDKKQALVELNSFSKFDMSACDKLFKKELFDEILFPINKKSEDLYIMYKIFFNANKIVYDSSKLYHYIQRSNSFSKSKRIDNFYIDACKEQQQFFKNNCYDILFAANTMYIFSLIFQYNIYILYEEKYSREWYKNIKCEVKKHMKEIIKNKNLPLQRKLQVLFFYYFNNIYSFLLKNKNRKKKMYK